MCTRPYVDMADCVDSKSSGKSPSLDVDAIIEDISREMAEQSKVNTHPELLLKELQRAARVIKQAQAFIVTAGAGLGIESGLPDFRDTKAFWDTYPQFRDAGIDLVGVSDPKTLTENPELIWGFFGHHFNMYRETNPNVSYDILKKWSEAMKEGYFIYTSAIDGHFQKAGFPTDRIVECYGNIYRLQYADKSISEDTWHLPDNTEFKVDPTTLKLTSQLPTATPIGSKNYFLRPNICMLKDYQWVGDVVDEQKRHFFAYHQKLVDELDVPFVVVEVGASSVESTVRYTSESLVTHNKGILIRINPLEADVPEGMKKHVSLPMGVSKALQEIDKILTDD